MFCSKCGKELSDNDVFCSGCGTKTDTTNNETSNCDREIEGNFPKATSKIPLHLQPKEVLIEQHRAVFLLSTNADGTLSLTNKRFIFTKDSAGKAFLKRAGLLGMALSMAAKVPNEIKIDEITNIEPTSYIGAKAGMLITIASGFQYKIYLYGGNTTVLCEQRDRMVELVRSTL